MKRKELKEVEGIRLTYICPPIPANSAIVVELDGKFQKYKPFDVVHVFNNSNCLLNVLINQNKEFAYPVAGKTEREIDKIYCHNLLIENTNPTVDVLAGEVVLMLERKGMTIDEWAKRQMRWRIW